MIASERLMVALLLVVFVVGCSSEEADEPRQLADSADARPAPPPLPPLSKPKARGADTQTTPKAPGGRRETKPSAQATELEGTWRYLGRSEKGKGSDVIHGGEFVFDGNMLLMKKGPDGWGEEATVTLDSKARPKTIDVQPKGSPTVIRGIYGVHGDMLTIGTAPPGQPRPTGLSYRKGMEMELVLQRGPAPNAAGSGREVDAPKAEGIDLAAAAVKPGDAPVVKAERVGEVWGVFPQSGTRSYDVAGPSVTVFKCDWGFEDEVCEMSGQWKWDGKPLMDGVVSRDGSRLVVFDEDFNISVWDTAKGSVITKYSHPKPENPRDFPAVNALVISPDGRLVVSSTFEHREYFAWEADTGENRWRFPAEDRIDKHVDFAPDGESVVLQQKTRLAVVDSATGTLKREVRLAPGEIKAIRYSTDCRHLVVAQASGGRYCVGVISLDTGNLLWAADTEMSFIAGVAFTPDREMIVATGNADSDTGEGVARFWDATDGTLRFVVPGLNATNMWERIRFSPDGNHFVASGQIYKIPGGAAGSRKPSTPTEGPTDTAEPPNKSASRIWTSADGRFTLEAELVKVVAGVVHLKRTDNGNVIQVPLNQLSRQDQEFLRKQ